MPKYTDGKQRWVSAYFVMDQWSNTNIAVENALWKKLVAEFWKENRNYESLLSVSTSLYWLVGRFVEPWECSKGAHTQRKPYVTHL